MRVSRAKTCAKQLTFRLSQHCYGIPIALVREVVKFESVTRVPHAAPSIRGLFNYRGRVVPVVDLCARLEPNSPQTTEQAVSIVVRYSAKAAERVAALLVDEVIDVRDVTDDEGSPASGYPLPAHVARLVDGVSATASRVTLLLNVERLLAPLG